MKLVSGAAARVGAALAALVGTIYTWANHHASAIRVIALWVSPRGGY
jgi:hypothetical protein